MPKGMAPPLPARPVRRPRAARAALAAAAAVLIAAGAPARPKLMMMTGLPIVWGEKGAFDPASRPAAAYLNLQKEFDIRLVDTLEPETLGTGRLLLLAQPQRLSPAELAAADGWVRGGGRALILADPALAWPSELPLGDIRRPPPTSLLGPLLDHWGLALAEGEAGRRDERLGERRLVLDSPGRFASRGGACVVEPEWLARCRIGAGRAILIADADLLRDDLLMGEEGDPPAAENGLVLADWLDELAGIQRARPGSRGGPGRIWGALLAAIASLAAAGVLLIRRRRRK